MACFHADAQYQYNEHSAVLIAEFFPRALGEASGLASKSHHLSNHMISFADADLADSQVYMLAYHLVAADAPDRPPYFPARGREYGVIIGGRYIDRFERRNGRWRIAHRTLNFDWHYDVEGTTIPLLPMAARDGGFGKTLSHLR
jgi:hypothetical protein